jgi:hypothetical protein
MTWKLAIPALIAGLMCLEPPAEGQTPAPALAQPNAGRPYVAPRTSSGDPSLEGIWTAKFILPMEASPLAKTLTLPEREAKTLAETFANQIAEQFEKILDPEVPENIKTTDGLAIVRGERRTRAVVVPPDGMLPYTSEARRESASGQAAQYDNIEERPNWERCITNLGLPPVTFIRNSPRQLVQTRSHVVLLMEYGGEARIIPLTGEHKPKTLHTVLGDSIASWEGETLVIETIGLPDKDRRRAFSNNLIVPGDSKVIERLTRISDGELLYQFTVEDPKTYAKPWLGEYSLFATSDRMFEHACHEGNYSVPNILQGARVIEARVAGKRY